MLSGAIRYAVLTYYRGDNMKHMIVGLGLMAVTLGAAAEGFSVSSTDMQADKPLTSAQVFQGFG